MICFEDQAALDDHVRRVLLAHLDASEESAKRAALATYHDLPSVAATLVESVVKVNFAVQRAAVMKLPLPVVRR